MKNRTLPITLLAAVAALGLASCGNTPQSSSSLDSSSSDPIDVNQSWQLKSIDSSIITTLSLTQNGSIYYNVKKDGRAVVNDSKLGFIFEEADLSSFLTFESKEERNNVRIAYENITGKKAKVTTAFNELSLTFLEFDYRMVVTFRCYNDGYAFRYSISKAHEEAVSVLKFENECSQFSLPTKSLTYSMAFTPSNTNTDGYPWYSYEDYYSYRRSDRLEANQSFGFPFVYKTTDEVYSLVTESDLIGSGYHGSFLSSDETGTLKTVHSPAGGKNPDLTVNLDFLSPWRVGIVGGLSDIVESTLVEDVYDECEFYKPDNFSTLNKEEQETYNYSWVDSTPTAWNWLYYNGSTPQNDFTLQQRSIDLAASMGWHWSILDGGWNAGKSDNEIRNLVTYAKNKGVKLMAWGDAFNDFGSAASIKVRLKNWKSLGIDGVKVDFWDGQNVSSTPAAQMEDKQIISLYETFYETAASLEMVVNCHGCNKPTGERRKFPNVINREAVRGNEFKSVSTEQTVFDSLIRSGIGPTDFTPTIKPFRAGITAAHQMALTITMESGMTSMADVESRYFEDNYNEFYKALPTIWDDTKLISGDLNQHAIIARKKGNDWWIGGITSKEPINKEVSFSFLDDGASYEMKLYKDNGTTGPDSTISIEVDTMNKQSTKTISMDEYGGFAIRLQKKTN